MIDPVLPIDLLIEREVDVAIANGMIAPRWGWRALGAYNGSTGAERIVGWQKVIVAEKLGLLPPREVCTVCGLAPATQRHSELYFRALICMPVCRSCHARIHRRFAGAASWLAFLRSRSQRPSHVEWATSLRTVELDRNEARKIAATPDIFAALAAD